MTSKPYPGYPPSMGVIPRVGNYSRTCVVIELLSSEPLTSVEISQLREHLEATIQHRYTSIIDHYDVATPDRFDRPLRQALRLGSN